MEDEEIDTQRVGLKRKRLIEFKVLERPMKKLKLSSVPIPDSFKSYPQYEMLKKLETAESKIDNFMEDRRTKLIRSSGKQLIESRNLQIEVYHDNVRKVSKQIAEFDINVKGIFTEGGDLIPFTELIDQIQLKFQKSSGIENVTWKKTFNEYEDEDEEEDMGRHNIISFERRARVRKNKPIQVVVEIDLHHEPPQFHMDEKIQSITNNKNKKEEALSVEEIVGFFFDYFREKNLFVINNPTMVFMDDYLKTLFKREVIHVNEVTNLISPYLHHPEPFIIEHSFLVHSNENEKTIETFEVRRNRSNLNVLLSEEYNEDVLQKEEEIRTLFDEGKTHLRKKEFLEEFADNPIDFSYELICSQTRDINVVNNYQMDDITTSRNFESSLTNESLVCMEEEIL